MREERHAGTRAKNRGQQVKIGDHVLITFNPHHYSAEEIIGKVVGVHPAAGFMSCDLVDVKYEHDGETHVRPFGMINVTPVNDADLTGRASALRRRADRLLALAAQVSREAMA